MLDLEQLSKEERYNIPEGYFENLTDNIMDVIHKDQRKRRNIWMTSIAAVCLVVISSVLFINLQTSDKKDAGTLVESPMPANNLDDQMIEYYSAELTEYDYYNF